MLAALYVEATQQLRDEERNLRGCMYNTLFPAATNTRSPRLNVVHVAAVRGLKLKAKGATTMAKLKIPVTQYIFVSLLTTVSVRNRHHLSSLLYAKSDCKSSIAIICLKAV